MELLRFAVIGLASGGIYGIIALGLVLGYRSSGLVNFAQGAFVVVGAYANYELIRAGLPPVGAAALACAVAAAAGALAYLLVIRPMRDTSPIARVIATLGLLLAAQAIGVLVYGPEVRSVRSLLPTGTVQLGLLGGVTLNRLLIFAVGAGLAVALWAFFRYSRFGAVTTAVATRPLSAETLGHSVDLVATVNWTLGAGLAGLAGVFAGPVIFLEPTSLVLLVLPALVAALMGGFASFPAAFAAACFIGMAQSVLQLYVSSPGWPTAMPLFIIVVWLFLRGRGLPVRGHLLDRLPAAASGRVRPLQALVVLGTALTLTALSDDGTATAFSSTAAIAIICLSIVIITGFTGQLSLVQYVLAGSGALIAAHLSGSLGFELATVTAAAAVSVLGIVLGIPALRTRGMTLAVVTLGMAVALYGVLLSNTHFTGGPAGIEVSPPTLFGVDLDPLFQPHRYAILTIGVLFLLACAVSNVRRGAMGRRLLAVRSNERGATSLGIGVATTKVYAFALAAAVASIGGTLLGFQQAAVLPERFTVFESIYVLGAVVVGGVGTVSGALVASLLVPGGILTELLSVWSQVDQYLPLAGALILIINLQTAPDGIVPTLSRAWRQWSFPGRVESVSPPAPSTTTPDIRRRTLRVTGLTVRFGGITALDSVELTVEPGRVHGLLGPNGAGKTTLIDAVTGFVPANGRVDLAGEDLSRLAPRARATRGVTRSFQSLELFDDLTVAENIATAGDRAVWWRGVTDLVCPGRPRIDTHARAVVDVFGLADLLSRRLDEISYGQRKAVAVVRALAARPSVLLLDEPAAGLDDLEAARLSTMITDVAQRWGIGILLVEHNVDMVLSASDSVTVLHTGRVIAHGSPDEVLADPAVRDAYLGAFQGGS